MGIYGDQPNVSPASNLGSFVYQELAFLPGSGDVVFMLQQSHPGSWIAIPSIQSVTVGSEAPTAGQSLMSVTGSSAVWKNTDKFAANKTTTQNYTTETDITGWNSSDFEDTPFSWSTDLGVLSITSDGDYEVSASVSSQVSSGATRSQSESVLCKNGFEVAGTRHEMYNREVTEGGACTSFTYPMTLSSGDTLKLRVARTSGTNITYVKRAQLYVKSI